MHNWSGSDLDGLVRFWANASCLEASHCAGITRPSFWQKATNLLLVSRFRTRLHSSTDSPDHIVQNQHRSDWVLADCQVLAQQIQSGSKPLCKNDPARFWPMLLSQSGLDADRIRHVYLYVSWREGNCLNGWSNCALYHRMTCTIHVDPCVCAVSDSGCTPAFCIILSGLVKCFLFSVLSVLVTDHFVRCYFTCLTTVP